MIINQNITGIGIFRTSQNRAKVVYTNIFSQERHDVYDEDFPIDEAREMMKELRRQLKAYKANFAEK